MECNKDEALRAKEIAEKKFTAKDIAGAKKFALKAQTLYPGLEGISHMLATLDVYIAAENRINGEADWYGILGVNPQADDETVRKQYRKLALMLHPDKNKSIGAEGAFKSISEAWSLVSDKAKRVAYDRRSGIKFPKVSTPTGGTSVPPRANGFCSFTKTTSSNAKSHKHSSRTAQSSAPPPPPPPPPAAPAQKSKPSTFWTVCHRCKMQYEYLRIYLNHNLLCPNCHEPFLAVETTPPPSNKPPISWNFPQQRQKSNQASSKSTSHQGRNNAASPNVRSGGFDGSNSYTQTNFQWGPFSKTTGASNAAQAATVVQQAYEKVKREREEAQAATKREEALRRKHASKKTGSNSSAGQSNVAKRRRGIYSVGEVGSGRDVINPVGVETGAAASVNLSKQGNFETVRVNGITKPYSTRDMSQSEMQNLLMGKARKEICEKLNEWKSAAVVETSGKDKDNGKHKVIEKGEKTLVDGGVCDKYKSAESVDGKNRESSIKSVPSSTNMDPEILETMSINVPDPDFHDFDKDRTEKSFEVNQVWSAYDNDDGMPRYYAMIHNVISLNPFKIRISWLNSKTNSELGPLNWVSSGFSKTCGDFRIGKHEINNSLNSFSHKVRWMKGARGTIRIYPRKGDVWAIYRNWSADWNELTADEVIHKYDMVEVLEDFDEELGVTVTPLVKVAGFKTVFHRHLDPGEVRRIPKEEMFRFSHHVPSYLLTGQEAPNAPKGCRELDPAATPLELLQVIADIKEEDMVETEEKSKEDDMANEVEKANDKEVVENSEEGRTEEKDSSKDAQEVQVVKDTIEIEEDETMEDAEEQPVG